MIMDKIITIAVPTYNMEEYLERCLESLLILFSLNEHRSTCNK